MAHLGTAGTAALRACGPSTLTRASDSPLAAAHSLSWRGCPGLRRQSQQCGLGGKGLRHRRGSLETARCSAEAKESSTDVPKADTQPSTPPSSSSSPPKAAVKGNKKGGFGKAPPPPPPKKEKPPSESIFAQPPAPSPGPRVARRPAPQKPLLTSDQTSEQAQQTETAIVSTLALIFVIILLEGLFLAAAGFLPEEWDEFALDNVYPAFSPTVGLFLLGAAGYGLFKFLGPQKK